MPASGVYSIQYQCWALSLEYDLFNKGFVNTFSESKVKFVLSYPPPPPSEIVFKPEVETYYYYYPIKKHVNMEQP